MIQSGTTDKFSKLLDKLPQQVRVEAQELFAPWRAMMAEAARPHNAGSLNNRWTDYARHIGLEKLRDDYYSCDIGARYRAVGIRHELQGQTQITWLWVGSHEGYNKLVSHGYNQDLHRLGNAGIVEAKARQDAFKRRRLRRPGGPT